MANVAVEDLHDTLDALWARYLAHLAAYETAQAELQKILSAAYFSLAQANFNKPSGRRYGRDYYDQRAVAGVRARIVEGSDEGPAQVRLHQISAPEKTTQASKPEPEEADTAENVDHEKPAEKSATRAKLTVENLLTPEPTPEPQQEPDGANEEQQDDGPPKSSDAGAPVPTDPLRAFAGGILIPPALRKAQNSFLALFADESGEGDGAAHETVLTRAVNAARAMREIEVEIRRLRKAIRKAERAA